MKLFYYTFDNNGVTMEKLTVRKNKEAFAVDAGVEYGGREHPFISYFPFEQEGKLMGVDEYGCNMYSTTVDKVSDEMIEFNKKRIEIAKQIKILKHDLKDLALKYQIKQ